VLGTNYLLRDTELLLNTFSKHLETYPISALQSRKKT